MDCDMNIAVGVEYKQCCCPKCNSMNINLSPIPTEFSDFEMHCNDCDEIWDGNVIGWCAFLGKEEKCPHRFIIKGERNDEI